MKSILTGFLAIVVVHCLSYLAANNWRMQFLLKFELELTRNLDVRLKERTNLLVRFTSRFVELSSRSALGSKYDYTNMPLPALIIIRRIAEEWNALAGMACRDYGLQQLGLKGVRWPTPYHVSLAAYTVMRSQWTYGLDTELLAKGVVSGNHVLANVTAADCFHIGVACLEYKNVKEAVGWFEQALHKISHGDTSVSSQIVKLHLIISMCYTGITVSASKPGVLFREMLATKLPTIQMYLMDYYKEMGLHDCQMLHNKFEETKKKEMFEGIVSLEALEVHRGLCRGRWKSDGKLQCHYLHYNLPHLRLQPFKVEELHLDPLVLRFYNVLSDSESVEMRAFALENLEEAEDVREGMVHMDNYRTSHVAWAFPGDSLVNDRLSRRMEDMAQLVIRTAEPSQITRYCISGEYLPHVDYVEDNDFPFLYNRISTLMFYLNDVKEGGNTIFPKLGLTVSPIKNSAILWFNLYPNGTVDPRSEHSGCPVLQGTKWVMVKWFHNEGQEFKKPCGLHQFDSFRQHYVN